MKTFLKKNFLYVLFFLFIVLPAAGNIIYASADYPDIRANAVIDNRDAARDHNQLDLTATVIYSDATRYINTARYFIPIPNSKGDFSKSDVQGSALGFMASAVSSMYTNPPADLAYWVQDTGETLGFLPHRTYAQAQGTGFNGLLPLLGLWKIFRNAAYVLLALALVIIGFMIMFRRKIDPKTVMTIQNALPRVIMVLILITFSYAIVGLLIDLMYVIMFFVITLFQTGLPAQNLDGFKAGAPGELYRLFAPLDLFSSGAGAAAKGTVVGGAIGSLIFPSIGTVLGGFFGLVGGTILNAVFSSNTIFDLISPILWLVFAIALVFVFLRVFFMLITAYLQILIAVIIGPLQILLDVFPGTNAFASWIMGIISNLLTFLLVSCLLVINLVILNNIGTEGLWSPPFIGGLNPSILKAIIGAGGMVMIPNLINNFKQALKAQSAVPLSAGSAVAPIGSAVGMLLPLFYQGSTVISLFRRDKHGQNPSARDVMATGAQMEIGQRLKGGGKPG